MTPGQPGWGGRRRHQGDGDELVVDICRTSNRRRVLWVVLLEAMAAGAAVVASDLDSFRDWAEMLPFLPCGEQRSTRHGSDRALENPGRRQTLAEDGRTLAEAHDWLWEARIASSTTRWSLRPAGARRYNRSSLNGAVRSGNGTDRGREASPRCSRAASSWMSSRRRGEDRRRGRRGGRNGPGKGSLRHPQARRGGQDGGPDQDRGDPGR